MSTSIQPPGIVVGVDGSPASKVAVDWAARDAAMRGIALTLVHVVSSVVAAPFPDTSAAGFGKWQQQKGRECLDEATRGRRRGTRGIGPVQVRSEMYYSATVPTLVDLSKGAELIVVGSRGHGAFGSLLGSVSAGLVQHAHCPVAVIHDEDPLMPHPAQAPVLVGIDGSPASELATAIAFDEASRTARGSHRPARMERCGSARLSRHGLVDDEVFGGRSPGRAPGGVAGTVPRRERPSPCRLWSPCSSAHRAFGRGAVGCRRQPGLGGFAGMLLGSVSAGVVQSARMPVIVARQA